VPEMNEPKTNDPKPDESQGVKRADAELTSAHERIETAKEELARLDRLVSGMERGERPSIQQTGTGAEPGGAAVSEAPPLQNTSSHASPQVTSSQNPSGNKAPRPGVKQGRPMLLALVGFWLAVCVVGAAFASKAIVGRWAPPVSIAHEASEPAGPKELVLAQAAAAPVQASPSAAPSQPAAPSQKETKGVPATVAAPSGDQASADLAQSLKTITSNLAGINEKLDQLKSSYDQKLREQADTIQQLKAAQQQSARDNARLGEQVQTLQAQPAASSAKPAAQSPKKESEAAVQQRRSVAFQPPRPRRPSAPWRRRPYLDGPYYDDPYDW
jgi:predicted  nucleic acid-binding Zn-ribbon protein